MAPSDLLIDAVRLTNVLTYLLTHTLNKFTGYVIWYKIMFVVSSSAMSTENIFNCFTL